MSDPHPFEGRLDRDCTVCGLPDRAAVHTTVTDPIMGYANDPTGEGFTGGPAMDLGDAVDDALRVAPVRPKPEFHCDTCGSDTHDTFVHDDTPVPVPPEFLAAFKPDDHGLTPAELHTLTPIYEVLPPDMFGTFERLVEQIVAARVKADGPVCASCGERAPYTIVLRGQRTRVCLRHLNHWRTPS